MNDEKRIGIEELQFFQKEIRLNAFREASNSVLDRGTKLNSKDMSYLTDALQKGKNKYIKAGKDGDKKAQSMIMQELPGMEKNWKDISEFRKQISVSAQNGQYGITEEFKTSTQGMDIAGILTGDNTPVINEDGMYGFMMTHPATGNKNWTSMRNIATMVKQNSFDVNSKKIIGAMGNHMLEVSGQEGAGEFNEAKIRRKVKTTIIDKGNIRSLTHDKILDDSFFNNTLNTVKKISYKNLGINKEGDLEDDDAKQVVNTLLADRETHLNHLTDHYTNFMKQNWINKKDRNKKQEQESTNITTAGQSGGQIIGNKYIPKA